MDIESIVPPVKPINGGASNPFADSSNPFDEEDSTSSLTANRRPEIYEGVPDFSDDDSTPISSKPYVHKPLSTQQPSQPPTKSVTINWTADELNSKQNSVHNIPHDKIVIDDPEPSNPSLRSSTLTSSTSPILHQVYQPWDIQFYSRWFDVDTKQVFLRMFRSLVPYSFHFFHSGSGKPDLYGPFWIGTTLIFLLTISSHLSKYLTDKEGYSYNFPLIGEGAIIIYFYLVFPSLCLFLVFKYFSIPIGLIGNLSVYGYSLTPYLITSVICCYPNNYVKWGANLAAGIWGAVFLVMQYAGGMKGEGWSGPLVKVVIGLIVAVGSLILCLVIKTVFYS